MDDLWHMKACQGLNRNPSLPSPLSASLNQFEMNSGQFGHPFVQQEVCVIERTIRQEPLGASLLNFGLQGPSIKSVRGDVGNPLLALVPGSQPQIRPSYLPAVHPPPRQTFSTSHPQAHQMGSISSPGIGSWPGHLLHVSGGNRVSGGGGSGHGVDASLNMLGREVNLSMLGRELNLAHYSRMTAGQECFEATRTSGVEILKQNGVHDNGNDRSGQSPIPQWLTEIISRQQRVQNMQNPPMFSSEASLPRAAESSRDDSNATSSLLPFASLTVRGARVVCINYDTGQRIGGELCLTQLGLLGVLCSCHGSHMSVAKFTQHVGIYSTNPGNVVAMDGTGECLVQWRRTLFLQYGVKVPEDTQGWDWSEGEICESGATKYKADVTQSWQKEVDVSCSGEPSLKSRVWDASLSPSIAANSQVTQRRANMELPSNIIESSSVQDSRESFLKSFGRGFRGNSMEFGSYPPAVEELEESVGRSQGAADMQSLRNSSHLGVNPSAEFFNFISGSQQFVSGHAEQQVAVERQIAVGRRSLLKGLDLAGNDRRESGQHEKDNSLSSFELRLGQPSQQSQPVGTPILTALANQMQRVMMQRVLDTGRQQNMQGHNATSAGGHHSFLGHQRSSNERLFSNQQNFEREIYMEPNHHSTSRFDPSRGMEGNSSVLLDHSSFKKMEEVSPVRFVENFRERENMLLSRDADQFSTEGARRWPGPGSFKTSGGLLMSSEDPPKRWENEPRHQIGSVVQSLSHGQQQDLDTILDDEWISKSRPTDSALTIEGRDDHVCHEESITQSRCNCQPSCREARGEEKEQFAYGDIDAVRGTRAGQGCICSNRGQSTSTFMVGKTFSKLGEHQDFCVKVDVQGNQVEPHRCRTNRDASQEPATHDCSSPRVCRLRSFQAITYQGCSCGGNGTEEYSNQGSRAVSVEDTNSGLNKRFSNPEDMAARSGLGESNNETFQWKEMSGIFVPGSETIADAEQDVMLPSRGQLEEDLLVDTALKANLTVAVSCGGSDKQHPGSDVCSKSSENPLSGFSDGTGAEVSKAQSVDKNPVESEVVDEGSGIGKCSSSDGVDMGLKLCLNMSSKDEDSVKHASPSSQGYPTFTNANKGLAVKVGIRSRVGYTLKKSAARHLEGDVQFNTGNVEKKRRRTMKWKRLDAAIGAADAQRQKLSTPGNMAKNFDAPEKLTEGSDICNSLRNKNLFEVSPSISVKVGPVQARKLLVTHGSYAASHAEHGMELNVRNGMNCLGTDERYLKKTETLVIRVPQGSNRKKAKRSRRPKPGKKKVPDAQQDHMSGNKSASPETNSVNPSTLDNAVIKDSVASGSFIPKSTPFLTNSVPHLPTPHVQPVKIGRVVLGRPSPRNATRMVSLNDIMNKPEAMATTSAKEPLKPLVLEHCLHSSAVHDVSRASGIEEDLNAGTSKACMKASTSKDRLETPPAEDSLRAFFMEESVKEYSPRVGLQVSSFREAVRAPAPKERLKVQSCASKDGSRVYSRDGLKVSLAKDGLNFSSSEDGLKASSPKDTRKAFSAEEGSKLCRPKGNLKGSGPIVTGPQSSSIDLAPKSFAWIPVAADGFKLTALKASSTVSFTRDCPKAPVSKIHLQVPASNNDGLKASVPRDGIKPSSPRDGFKSSAPRDGFKSSVPRDGFKSSAPKDGLKASGSKYGLKRSAPEDGVKASAPRDALKAPTPKDGLKSVGAKDCLKVTPQRDVWRVAAQKNGTKAATLKDRLNPSTSRSASQDSFPLDNGNTTTPQRDVWRVAAQKNGSKAATPKDMSNASVCKDGRMTLLRIDSLKPSSKAKIEGQGHRKPVAGFAIVATAQDNQEEESLLTWKKSINLCKSSRQEVRKVRSLYELTADRKLPVPDAGVFEFHDEGMESLGVLEQNSCNRPSMPLQSTFSVPVHFSDTKCLVPRGERSPRGKLARMKNMFWQGHKAGSTSGNQLAAEPVEIVVGRSVVQDLGPITCTPMSMEKEKFSVAKLQPGSSRVQFPQDNEKKREGNDVTPKVHVASGMVAAKEVFDGVMDYTGARSYKRNAEQLEVVAIKKQKLLGTSKPTSGLLKIRRPFPTCIPATSDPPTGVLNSSEANEKKMKHQTVDDDAKISGRKKRCQRPKQFDYSVPKGVVECCVCGSSGSELFNQIVCCSGCPVKVHQACYGVKKIPYSAWLCRTCKASATHPICVVCGYGGGAMTRAHKAKGFVKGLLKAWQEKVNTKEKVDICIPCSPSIAENVGHMGQNFGDLQNFKEKHERSGFSGSGNQGRNGISNFSELDSTVTSYPYCIQKHERLVPGKSSTPGNTITLGEVDSTVVQWVHMVCALWMPGTRCLNFGTMGVFDVSGVSQVRRKLICSICNQKGGACIQCRVVKCSIPFHAWCAHEQGLLQSEIVEDGSDQIGFYGKCLHHGKGGDLLNDTPDITDIVLDVLVGKSTCARTEGYKGKLSLEERALYRRQATRNGSAAVSPEQVAAWLRINERKSCKARQFFKSANSDQKTDHREYLRFKQEQGWQRLSVYKSGIHALGLYTAEFIGRGEMVVEYIGEIVGLRVADKREADYHSGKRMQYQGACYLFRIDRERIIDATRKGGIARFVNHSCSVLEVSLMVDSGPVCLSELRFVGDDEQPNCVAKVICVKNQSKVVFFAQRDIYAGEEITYDYQFNFEQEGDKIPCFCGSANCRGTLN